MKQQSTLTFSDDMIRPRQKYDERLSLRDLEVNDANYKVRVTIGHIMMLPVIFSSSIRRGC